MANKKQKVKAYVKKKKHVPESKIIENLLSKYNTIDVTKTKKFSDLPLSKNTLNGLTECDYVDMTDIQKQSISLTLQGNDILGAAKTGSGKTLAFLIPVLENLYCKQWSTLDGVGALIITPTRELAYQIYETSRKIGYHHNMSVGLVIGGKDLKHESKRINQCNIVICTPGRLLQHMDENPLFNCVNMQILVLDEADRCLDMGFEKTMNAIIENLPSKRQTLLFSATQTKSVKDLARLSLKDPLYVSVHEHSTHTTPEGLQQNYIVCALEDKIAMLWSFIRNHLKEKIIVFLSTCKQVKYVYEAFCRLRPGISLLAYYGKLHELKRIKIYDSFCKKQHAVLFATDIAARGLDIPVVSWVIQMDCPEDVNTYIHRAGRTARFKNGGESLLVLLPSEEAMVEKLKQRKIPIDMIQINPNKLQSPHHQLTCLLKNDIALKESAQKAFRTYIRSVYLMTDKEIFNVHTLNLDLYANSLGLTTVPRVRFLQRMQKKITTSSIKIEEETDKILINLADSEQESSEEDSDTCAISNTTNNKKMIDEKQDVAALQFDTDNDDDDDDVVTMKKDNTGNKNRLVVNNNNSHDSNSDSNKKTSKTKLITKVATAKKILKEKKVPNKKIVFNEDGQELTDFTKTRILKLPQNKGTKQNENEVNSESKPIMQHFKQMFLEKNQYDKRVFKEELKLKKKEEKRKLKAAKKEKTDDEEMNENEFRQSKASEDAFDSEPDVSWLPDPDKIYNKKQNSDEEVSVNESEEDESEEESTVHRPSKRKTQEEHKRIQKKQKVSDIVTSMNEFDIQTNENLALQCLRKN